MRLTGDLCSSDGSYGSLRACPASEQVREMESNASGVTGLELESGGRGIAFPRAALVPGRFTCALSLIAYRIFSLGFWYILKYRFVYARAVE